MSGLTMVYGIYIYTYIYIYSVTIYSFWKELVKNFHYFSQVRFYLFILLGMICRNQERTKYFDHKYTNKYINIIQMYTQLINYEIMYDTLWLHIIAISAEFLAYS